MFESLGSRAVYLQVCDEGAERFLPNVLWEQSCQAAQESCEAAASALAWLSNGLRIPIGEFVAEETVNDARNETSKAVVERVEEWRVCNTSYGDKNLDLSERLACEAGCRDLTVSQLVNIVRRLAELRHEQRARGMVRLEPRMLLCHN